VDFTERKLKKSKNDATPQIQKNVQQFMGRRRVLWAAESAPKLKKHYNFSGRNHRGQKQSRIVFIYSALMENTRIYEKSVRPRWSRRANMVVSSSNRSVNDDD
jgi:hypothetical protein